MDTCEILDEECVMLGCRARAEHIYYDSHPTDDEGGWDDYETPLCAQHFKEVSPWP